MAGLGLPGSGSPSPISLSGESCRPRRTSGYRSRASPKLGRRYEGLSSLPGWRDAVAAKDAAAVAWFAKWEGGECLCWLMYRKPLHRAFSDSQEKLPVTSASLACTETSCLLYQLPEATVVATGVSCTG